MIIQIQTKPEHSKTARTMRGGFTLIELLVSVGLVVLMMTMFSVVFQLASGSISTQRGIAQNDQRSRTLGTIMRSDLANRTFKNVIPYAPNEVADANKQGYFSISENDPDNDTDDVLQFTTEIKSGEVRYIGHAKPLGIPESAPEWEKNTNYTQGTWVEPVGANPNGLVFIAETTGISSDDPPGEPTWPSGPNQTITDNTITWRSYSISDNRNQPEWDDGTGGDDSGASDYAEISYFLRQGTLYRRVMLIRQPLIGSGVQPQDENTNVEFLDPSRPFYRGNYYRDFDFSSRVVVSGGSLKIELNGIDSADDSLQNTIVPGSTDDDLGRPNNRFGHNYATGLPREYLDPTDPKTFIGRFTHEETSHSAFSSYPLPDPSTNPNKNPFSRGDSPAYTIGNRGIIEELTGGPRRAEDVLMSNVQRFDIKVWDEALEQFMDVGHATVGGDFAQTNNAQTTYGPKAANNRVFDTWHPAFDFNGDTLPLDNPPFRPVRAAIPTPNPIPLRAVQITIQYYDPNSEQVRQMTIVQSLIP